MGYGQSHEANNGWWTPHLWRGATILNLGVLSKHKRVFHINAEITNGIFDLAMAEKDLDSPQIARCPVDDRCLRSPQRMGSILAAHQPHSSHPLIDKPRILSGAEMTVAINPAWKNKILHRAAATLKPRQQAAASVWQEFELDGAAGLLLDYHRACTNGPAADYIADLQSHKVTAAKFAING